MKYNSGLLNDYYTCDEKTKAKVFIYNTWKGNYWVCRCTLQFCSLSLSWWFITSYVKLIRDFLWGGWAQLSSSCWLEGGFLPGVGDGNKALFGKRLWRFSFEKESLMEDGSWQLRVHMGACTTGPIWIRYVQTWDDLNKISSFKVVNGQRGFCYYAWCGHRLSRVAFPNLLVLQWRRIFGCGLLVLSPWNWGMDPAV